MKLWFIVLFCRVLWIEYDNYMEFNNKLLNEVQDQENDRMYDNYFTGVRSWEINVCNKIVCLLLELQINCMSLHFLIECWQLRYHYLVYFISDFALFCFYFLGNFSRNVHKPLQLLNFLYLPVRGRSHCITGHQCLYSIIWNIKPVLFWFTWSQK